MFHLLSMVIDELVTKRSIGLFITKISACQSYCGFCICVCVCVCLLYTHTHIRPLHTLIHEIRKRRSSNEKRCGYIVYGIESCHKFMSFLACVFYLQCLMEYTYLYVWYFWDIKMEKFVSQFILLTELVKHIYIYRH